MVVWEIEMRRALASSIPNDSRIVHFPENHTDTGTARIPARRVIAGIDHVYVDMMTVVRIPRRNGNPIMLPWTQ